MQEPPHEPHTPSDEPHTPPEEPHAPTEEPHTPTTGSFVGRSVRGAQLAFVGWAMAQGIGFVTYLVLARLVTPRGFGEFAAGGVILGIGGLAAEGGMMSALITRKDRIDEAASTAFFTLLITGTVLTAAGVAVSPLFGLFFRSSRVQEVAAVLSAGLFFQAASVVPDALLQRRLSFARRVAIDPLAALLFAAVSIVVAAEGGGVWSLVAGTYASLAMTVCAGYAFARVRPSLKKASFGMWRELARFARPVIFAETLRRVAAQLDTITLGRVAGAATLGQYKNGNKIAVQPVGAFVDVGSYVLLPVLSRVAGDSARLNAAVHRIWRVAGAVSFPVTLALIPLGVPIAVLSLGHEWRPAGHAVAGLAGLLLGETLISISSEVAKACHRPRLLVRVHSFSLVAIAVFVVGLTIPFGLIGTAIGLSVGTCLTGLFAFRLVAPLVGIGWGFIATAFGWPTVASAPMLVAMYVFERAVGLLDHGEVIGLALFAADVVVGALVYLVVLLALDRRRMDDIRRLATLRRAGQGSATA